MVAMLFGLILPTKSVADYTGNAERLQHSAKMLPNSEEHHAWCCRLESLKGSLWVTIDKAIAPNSGHIALVKQVRNIHLQLQTTHPWSIAVDT